MGPEWMPIFYEISVGLWITVLLKIEIYISVDIQQLLIIFYDFF